MLCNFPKVNKIDVISAVRIIKSKLKFLHKVQSKKVERLLKHQLELLALLVPFKNSITISDVRKFYPIADFQLLKLKQNIISLSRILIQYKYEAQFRMARCVLEE